MQALPEFVALLQEVRPGAVVGELLGVGVTGPVVAIDDPELGAGAAKAAVSPDFTHAQRAAMVAGEADKLQRVAGPHTLRLLATYPQELVPFLITERLPVPSLLTLLDGTAGVGTAGGRPGAAGDAMAGRPASSPAAVSASLPPAEAAVAAPLPSAHAAVAALLGVASALWSCHDAGLVHLDLKPRNVGVSAADRATLMDFGLARSRLAAGRHKLPAGTLPYSAPELVRVGDVGPHTDVWGWGLLAHILLAGGRYPGRRPASWGELFRTGAVVPPPVAATRTDLPPGLAAVIDRAVAADARARPADGAALFGEVSAAAIAAWGEGWVNATPFRVVAP